MEYGTYSKLIMKKIFYTILFLSAFGIFNIAHADTIYEYKTKSEASIESYGITNITGDYTYRAGIYIDNNTITELQENFANTSFAILKQGTPDATAITLKIYEAVSQTELGNLIHTSYPYATSGIPDYTTFETLCPEITNTNNITNECLNVTFSFSENVTLDPGEYFFLIEQNGTASGTNYFQLIGRVNASDVGQGRGRCKDNTECQTNTIRNIFTKFTNDNISFNAEVRPSYPLAPNTTSTIFNFTGSYDNPGIEYNQIQIQITNTEGIYRILTQNLPIGIYQTMYNLPYTVNSGTFNTGSYSYQVRLYNTTDNSFTEWTTEIPFTVDYIIPDEYVEETCTDIVSDFQGCVKNLVHDTIDFLIETANRLFQPLQGFLENLWEEDFFSNFFPLNILLDLNDIFNQTISGDEHITLDLETGFGEIAVVDTVTAENWIGTTAVNTIKNLVGYALWLALFWFMYHTLHGVFIKMTNIKHE
jgi:hypothetical protein